MGNAIKIESMVDLNNAEAYLLPIVFADVQKRISDWLSSGGKETDDYINRQFKEVLVNLLIPPFF